MKKYIILLLMAGVLCFSGCGSKGTMKEGFYTAEMADYSHGWKEYVCIMVKNGSIMSAEFNAKDPNGYIKAWDNAYMGQMLSEAGTYPNEYTRYYTAKLIEKQDASGVDALSGASHSGSNFNRLVAAAIRQAEKGDHNTVQVEPEPEE